MFVNGIAHHNEVREKLIELYKIMTRQYFPVVTSRAAFLTTEQLEYIEQNPPLAGVELYSTSYPTDITIERMIKAYLLGGEGFQMAFQNPARDIITVYETLQESVRLWTDIKLNSYECDTAPMEELEAMEMVARSLFGLYKTYYEAKVKSELALDKINLDEPFSMAKVYLNIMNYGMEEQEEISFISYVDLYRAKQRGECNSFTGSYAKQNLSIDDIPPAQPRQYVKKKEKSGMGNWLDD